METTAYRSSMTSRAFDVDQTRTDPEAMPYRLARADRVDFPPQDPIPLFLSDPEGEPDPLEFAPQGIRSRVRFATQAVASVLAASAVAVLVVLFHTDVSRLFTASAGAWVGSVMANQSATTPANASVAPPVPSKDVARVAAPAPLQLASAAPNDIVAPVQPSREAIAAAYQTAVQAQSVAPAPAEPPAPAAPPAPVVKTLDADTLAGLMTRAKSLIAVGDIAAARLLLERAAYAQDAAAALLLAQTYDPAVLGTSDTRSITADPALARDWYQKASQLGSADARQRLSQLQN